MIWFLVLFLTLALIAGIFMIVGEVFSEENELVREAEEKIEQGDREQAVSILSKITNLNPANFKARWRLAKILQTMGNFNQAAQQIEQCLKKNGLPDHVRQQDALSRLAQVYENDNQHQQAIDGWSRYLMQVPDSMEAYFRRGKLWYKEQRYERAKVDFDRLISEFEDAPDQALLYRARCLSRIEEDERAIPVYENYLDKQPNDLEAAIELANLCEQVENWDQAQQWYNHALDRAHGDLHGETMCRLAELALHKDEIDEADGLLNDVEELLDDGELSQELNTNRMYTRALYYQATGDEEEARSLFKQVYQIQPAFRDVSDIIENQIGDLDDEQLIDFFMKLDRSQFNELCEKVVQMMGYDVVRTESFGPDEVNVMAHEETGAARRDRVLCAFKRWDNRIGEWPIKEFELEMLEDRFDRGMFIAPRGFKSSAEEYTRDASIRLIGPDSLIQYLEEVKKEL